MKLWIARDKDGELCLYQTKPWKRVNTIHYNDEFDNQVIIATVVKDQELFIKRKLKLVI